MNKVPVVFTFDKNEVLSASVAIKSMLDSKNPDTEYDIFVLCDASVNQKLREKFKKIADIHWIEIDKNVFKGCPIKKTWPEAVYYRLLIPNFIKNYDKVIYSDTDVFFKGDLASLYQTDIEGYDWGGVMAEKNSPDIDCHTYHIENKNEYVYMSGFMLMNLKKMREENKVQKFFETIECFKDRLKMFDLEVLNISCDNILGLPFRYCMLVNLWENDDIAKAEEFPWLVKQYPKEILEEEKKNAVIIHYAGQIKKIWNRDFYKIPKYYIYYILSSPFSYIFYKRIIKEYLKITFSINNEIHNNKKYKVLRLLGIKIKFRIKY